MGMPMTPERLRLISNVLDRVLFTSGARRSELIADACAGDPSLVSEVEALLDAEAQAGHLSNDIASQLVSRKDVPASSALSALQPGALLGTRYRIVSRIACGGTGEVFRVDDLQLGEAIALKCLPAAFANGTETNGAATSESGPGTG